VTQALHFATALLPGGWQSDVRLGIAAGRIISLETKANAEPGDERHAIGLPGISNLHSHAFQRAMAGLAEYGGAGPDDFWTWREVMYRTALSITPDDVEAIATQLYVEMLEAGFTRVGEFHYLHHDQDGCRYSDIAEMSKRIVAAANETGIGLTLLPVFYAHGDFGGAPPTNGQRRFVSTIDGFARLFAESRAAVAKLDGAILGIAPHSLRAVTPEQLSTLIPLAGAAPIHIHAAEQMREVEACVAWSARRPVEWLLENAPLDERWCLIHATHMTEEETEALASSGTTAGLCPITEANLGDGVFKGRMFLDGRGTFGIGSDSNVLIDAAGELRQLEYAQRLGDRARNRMSLSGKSTGRTLFDAVLHGGALALGAVELGLTRGSPANIISLQSDQVALDGMTGDRILDAWIFAAREPLIDCVWARGTKLVVGGRHRQHDAARARFRKVVRKLV